MPDAPAQTTGSAVDAMTANLMARNAITARALNMTQQIFTSGPLTNYVPGQPLPINVPVRNVGLIKRFYIEIVANVQQGAAETQTLCPLGPANVLSNINLTDLSNQARVNTTGWHLHFIASFRRQLAFGAAFSSDTPTGIGSNFNVIKAPASVTAAQNLYMVYEVPVSYGDLDLRGAIYANILNATMQLQLIVNPNFFVGSAANGTQAVYKSSTGQLGKINSITVNVYQNYYDQIPQDAKGTVQLPFIDLSTAYLLNNSNVQSLGQGADQAIPYSNFRNFLSTIIIYDNNGQLNPGTDINYFAMQSANFTNMFKYDPMLAALLTRTKINDDLPPGCYYFDHRDRPLSTVQYGNMQLIVNPSLVNSAGGSQILTAYESMAMLNQITQAGSLFQN